MKRIALAIGTVAMGLATTAGTIFAQSPSAPRGGYSLYGGPPESRSETPERHGVPAPSVSPIYKMYGVPDDIAAADSAREARRNAAVEFGMFRRQFTGSTEFWMDHDRTQLAKARYAMDEPMWRSIHPAYEFGDGGYMYNTAASVGGPQWAGSPERVIITAPEPYRAAPVPFVSNAAPAVAPPTVPAQHVAPLRAPLVASDAGDVNR
jgi:hypothetical protein